LSNLWRPASQGAIRVLIIGALIIFPTVANYVGVRTGAVLSNVLTGAKLLPLLLLALLGLGNFGRHPQMISASEFTQGGLSPWLKAFLLLIFAYSGFENTLAPSGEVKEPRRTIPFALTAGITICACIYALIQFVVVATVGTAEHPLAVADTASSLLGRGGSFFVAIGVMLSTYGWISADILTSPRIIYSFAASGDAPSYLAKVNSRFNVPTVAVIFYSCLVWVLAVTGTFLWVAAVGAASALILYSGVCASLIRLRRQRPAADAFRIPGGPALAIVAIAVSLALISTLDRSQLMLMIFTFLVATANWSWAKGRAKVKDSMATAS